MWFLKIQYKHSPLSVVKSSDVLKTASSCCMRHGGDVLYFLHTFNKGCYYFFLQTHSEPHSKFVLCIIIICMQLSMHKSHFHFRAFEETHFFISCCGCLCVEIVLREEEEKTIKILVDGLNAW